MEKFTKAGNDSAVSDFIFSVEARVGGRFTATDMTDSEKITFLSSYLGSGQPISWHNSWVAANAAAVIEGKPSKTFVQYLADFRASFGNPNAKEEAFVKLEKYEQRGDVLPYSIEIQRLQRLSGAPDPFTLRCFKRGLKPRISEALIIRGMPTTLKEAIDTAILLDHEFSITGSNCYGAGTEMKPR